MVDFPDELLTVIKLAVQKHNEPTSAIAEADRQVRRLPIYADWIDKLVTSAVAELVYQQRTINNRVLKQQAGEYGKQAKVRVGESDAVNEVYASYYTYAIGKTILGHVTGEELEGIAQKERALAGGHIFNARLCEELAAMVPEKKRVQDVVSERKLKALFARLKDDRAEAA